MEDLQSARDDRGVALDHVGVSGLSYPIVVWDRAQERQQTVGTFAMSVSLPQHFKGTHMSRFIEVLDDHRGEITLHTMPSLLSDLQQRLEAERARVEVRFPYFLERAAPVSGARSLMDYECAFVGEVKAHGKGAMDFLLEVNVPLTSLCPCSKAISDYGAHNQRSRMTLQVRAQPEEMIWIEELVQLAERCGSAPVYPLLKRADERHVTMQAYDNPMFVEDMVRAAALELRQDKRVSWFRVHAENHESIHNHAAFASVEETLA